MGLRAYRRRTRKRQLMANLSLPTVLEEAGPPEATLHLASILTMLVAGALLWAGMTKIGEVATTSGQIVPGVPLQSVQHLEGGIVEGILIEEGSPVTVGQELIRLRAAAASADLDQLQARQAALRFEVERLRAYVEDRDIVFPADAGFADLQEDQREILKSRREADSSARGVVLSQIDQKLLELDGLRNKRISLRAQLATLNEQLALREELFSRGLGSRLVTLEARRAVEAAEAQLVETDAGVAGALEAAAEAEARLLELESSNIAEARDEMASASAELAEVTSTIAKIEDRFERLVIRAPVTGIVQSLAIETIGGVIAPGQELLSIVPSDGVLLAEVRVQPKDIGSVAIGQQASVKVSAFDVARLGDIRGHVTQLSATTLVDEQGEPYYAAQIALEQNHVGNPDDGNFVLPGMVVTADLKTGSRSVLQYLAGPAYRTFNSALRER